MVNSQTVYGTMVKEKVNTGLLCKLIYLIGFLDLLAVSIIFPLLPQVAKELGSSPFVIGLFSSIYGAVQLVSSPAIGHLGDIKGRFPVLYLCLLIAALGYFLSSFFVFSLILLSIVRILIGTFKHTQDLCRNCLADISDKSEKTKVVGYFNSLSNIGFIIGPSLSGILSNNLGIIIALSWSFILCSVLFLVNAVIVRHVLMPETKGLKPQVKKDNKELPSVWMQIKEIDWQNHKGLFLSRFLFALAVLLYRSSFVLGLKNMYSMDPAMIGYVMSYNGFMGFSLGLILSRISATSYYADKEEKLLLHGAIIIPLGFLIICFATEIFILGIGLAVLVVGTSTSRSCGVVLTAKRAGSEDVGKLLGFSSSILSVARSAAPFMAGIAQEFSYQAPVVISLCISLVALCVYYVQVYKDAAHAKQL